jgi:hypothetical protein
MRPFSGQLARRPSAFMCPIFGPMALRRLRSSARSGVMPRLVPLIRTLAVSTPWPPWPRSTTAGSGLCSVRMATWRKRRRQGMAVVAGAGEAVGTDDEAPVESGGEAEPGAEVVTDAGLAPGDAVHIGLVQGVDPVPAFPVFVQAAARPARAPPAPFRAADLRECPANVPAHSADMALELAQGLAHTLELPGVGMSRPTWGGPVAVKAGPALPEIATCLFRQAHQPCARPLVSRASVGWAMAFSIAVVSAATRFRLLSVTVPEARPASMVLVGSRSTRSAHRASLADALAPEGQG